MKPYDYSYLKKYSACACMGKDCSSYMRCFYPEQFAKIVEQHRLTYLLQDILKNKLT